MKLSLINYFTFQIGWLACVLGAAHGKPLMGLLIAVLIIALHLALANRRWTEAKLLLYCAAIGTVFDSLLMATGWVSYPNGEWLPGIAPYWIVAMWLLFGATLNLSLSWLKGRVYLAAFMGALGGPLSYIAGQNLNAIRLEQPEPALILVTIAWAIMMPALCVLAERLNGFERPATATVRHMGWSNEPVNDHA